MVELQKVFNRFPNLTTEQRNLLAKRRLRAALDQLSFEQGQRFDIWYAVGFLGISSNFSKVMLWLQWRFSSLPETSKWRFLRKTKTSQTQFEPLNWLSYECLCFPYSKHLSPAHGAHTLYRWPAILECNLSGISYLNLLSTLHAISCCHNTLLGSKFSVLLLHERRYVNSA